MISPAGWRASATGSRKSADLRRLVNEVTEFRNVFWWETVTRHGNANIILQQLHAAHRTPRLFGRVIADLDAFRQQVEAQALEASVRVQERDEQRSCRFEHAVSVAALAIILPALVFAGLTLPVHGVTSDGHDTPAWLIIVIGLGSMLAGAIAGAAGARGSRAGRHDPPRARRMADRVQAPGPAVAVTSPRRYEPGYPPRRDIDSVF